MGRLANDEAMISKKEIEALQDKFDHIAQEERTAQAELEKYKRDATLRKHLDSLKSTDLQSLMSHSARVADTLNTLMVNIRPLSPTKDNEEDE